MYGIFLLNTGHNLNNENTKGIISENTAGWVFNNHDRSGNNFIDPLILGDYPYIMHNKSCGHPIL